jgi:hypothetical protein
MDGYVARTGEISSRKFQFENQKGRDQFGNLFVSGKVTLRK